MFSLLLVVCRPSCLAVVSACSCFHTQPVVWHSAVSSRSMCSLVSALTAQWTNSAMDETGHRPTVCIRQCCGATVWSVGDMWCVHCIVWSAWRVRGVVCAGVLLRFLSTPHCCAAYLPVRRARLRRAVGVWWYGVSYYRRWLCWLCWLCVPLPPATTDWLC